MNVSILRNRTMHQQLNNRFILAVYTGRAEMKHKFLVCTFDNLDRNHSCISYILSYRHYYLSSTQQIAFLILPLSKLNNTKKTAKLIESRFVNIDSLNMRNVWIEQTLLAMQCKIKEFIGILVVSVVVYCLASINHHKMMICLIWLYYF